MKIVHITHLYHPSEGGVQFLFKNFSERLVKDYGDDVTVVTTNSYYGPERKTFKKITPSQEVINGVKVIRFGYRRWHIRLYSFIFKILAKLSIAPPEKMVHEANGPCSSAMKKYLLHVKADAICGSSSNYYFMQLPLWRKCNFFYYGSIHLPQDESKKVLHRQQVKSINASTFYFANTNYEKQRLERNGVEQGKIVVLGTGVNMNGFVVNDVEISAFRKSLQIPEAAVVAAYIGRIESTKNVQALIKSFETLATHKPELYLLIAGSGGDYAAALQDYCSKLPPAIASRIKWQVNFAAEVKAVLFNSIDILILPSHNESFGIVFIEAWTCKKPVIGTSIGAVKDVINENEDGLLMKPDDVDSLTQQLEKLVDDKDLRKQMGQRGYDKVRANYTWDIITAKLRDCYLSGVKNNHQKN